MHGGDRDKGTAWWSDDPQSPNVDLFASLALVCYGSHTHASWRPYKSGNGINNSCRTALSMAKMSGGVKPRVAKQGKRKGRMKARV